MAGCAGPQGPQASLDEIAAKAYTPDGPPRLTLFTVVNNTSGAGGHSALMVSASQQVIFDPAGSFAHPQAPERGDVLYGMSPGWVAAYKSAHARSTFHVVSQEIEVSHAQAEQALDLVRSHGPVGPAFCANATSAVLRAIPGFESIAATFFPVRLMDQVAQRPDVRTEKYYETDTGDVVDGIAAAQF